MKYKKVKKESEVQRVLYSRINPVATKILLNRGFVKIDIGELGGSHLTCFCIKNEKLFYFDSFGGAADKILLNQLQKPLICQKYSKQDNKTRLSGTYCLYFFF